MTLSRPTAAVLLASLALPSAAAPPVPTFGSQISVVRIAVVAREKGGAPVRGLTREDFAILEDDKPQSLVSFHFEEVTTTPAPQGDTSLPAMAPVLEATDARKTTTNREGPVIDLPGRRLVVLLFDTSALEPEELLRATTSAREYIARGMSAADTVAVASIGDTGLQVNQDFTTERSLVNQAIDRVSGLGQITGQASSDSDSDSFAPDTSELDLFNVDRRLRAIENLADALAPIQQKKSVVFFTNGMTGVGSDNQVALRAATDRAVRANLAVYPVDTRGLTASVPGGEARQASAVSTDTFSGRGMARQAEEQTATQDTLFALAHDTGGQASLDSNDWTGVYERVLKDSSAYYLLGFESGNPASDGRLRRLKVRVREPGVVVEHRSGYYAPRDFAHSRKEDREHQLEEQLFSDLSSRDIPVWFQAAHFREADDRFQVRLAVAVPGASIPFVQKGPNEKATLDLVGIVRDEAGRAVARIRDTAEVNTEGGAARRRNVQYQTGFVLPPGRFRTKIVVRENEGGAFGSFEADIVVPDLRKAKVKVSTVVLGTQLQASKTKNGQNPLVRDGSEIIPSVTHVVSSTQPVYFYFEVYEPGRTTSGEAQVSSTIAFYRGGARRYETPAIEVTRVDGGSRKAALFQIAVPSALLEPGLYMCQVSIIDHTTGAFAFPRLALLVK